MCNGLRSHGTILQPIYGEGFLSPEVGNDLRGIRSFIQITGITHTTEFDDNYRTEIEQKRARRTTAHVTKMAYLFTQRLHGDTQAGLIVSIQEWP